MKIIEAMILQQNYAQKWAGKVVSEMIKNGANQDVMRRHDIPLSVFYCVLGGAYWQRCTVKECADKMLNAYRHDYLYSPTQKLTRLSGGAPLLGALIEVLK